MRRIFAFLVATLDGYYEGAGGEFDWPVVDEEFDRFSAEQLDEADTLLFGRVTYEGMAQYWATDLSAGDDADVRRRMNDLQKLVVSDTLRDLEWANSRLVTPAELAGLKSGPGGDIAILGSSALTASLLEQGLVDELRVMVSPVVLGDGRSLFHTATHRIALSLLAVRVFDSGNVLLRYAPA
jgi:dihydrofolate reductase